MKFKIQFFSHTMHIKSVLSYKWLVTSILHSADRERFYLCKKFCWIALL